MKRGRRNSIPVAVYPTVFWLHQCGIGSRLIATMLEESGILTSHSAVFRLVKRQPPYSDVRPSAEQNPSTPHPSRETVWRAFKERKKAKATTQSHERKRQRSPSSHKVARTVRLHQTQAALKLSVQGGLKDLLTGGTDLEYAELPEGYIELGKAYQQLRRLIAADRRR